MKWSKKLRVVNISLKQGLMMLKRSCARDAQGGEQTVTEGNGMNDVPSSAAVLDTGRKVWCVHYTPQLCHV